MFFRLIGGADTFHKKFALIPYCVSNKDKFIVIL